MSLITTRYNWQANELSMGQADIARLWCVNPRTVKRELALLREMGWISVKYPGARGRVSVYSFDLQRILNDTRPSWEHIGPDLIARLTETPEGTTPPLTGNVVPLHRPEPSSARGSEGQGVWTRMRHLLAADNEALFTAWFAPMIERAQDGGPTDHLTLLAPSAFHKSYIETHLLQILQQALLRVGGPPMRIVIEI